MRAAGLSHLTAVSGGNFAIVMAAVLLVLRLLRRSRTMQVLGCFLAVSGYGALVGPQPSVLRAAAMAVVGLLGILSGGPARGVAALSSCVAALLLACPELAWSLGFALSVAATAGLLLLVTPAARVLPLPLIVAVPLAVAVAAHLATAPLLMLSGSPVSWVAVPANLLVSPCVAPITVLGLIGSLVAPVSPGAAGIIGHLALPFAQAVVVVAGGAQAVADSAVAAVAVPVVFGAGSAIGVWWLGARLARPRTAAVAAGAVLLVGVIVAAGHRGPPGWRLVVCDVGQGTAVLARTGVDSAVLFDTGPDGDAAASCAVRLHLRRLEAVVLSHFHADHVGGLPAVLSAYPGTPVMATTFTRPATMVSAVSQVAGVPAGAGEGDAVGWAGLRADALWPPRAFVGADSQANNGSLVAAVRWADGFSALIPGDVEPESQSRLMRSPSRPVDVVVIPHHGSDHQDPRFAEWVSARVAIASVGAGNTYGHPAPATLQEYAASGAAVRRTDLDGCIAVGGAPGAVWVAPC
ncbi:MAG: ComEC/Rec2 family competence protein [Candidatus Nanopelagicales bacterium]